MAKTNLRINWGSSGFAPNDWWFIYCLILKYKIKTVLEYGCGVSTELLCAIGMKVLSLETQSEWATPYMERNGYHIMLCNYNNYPDIKQKFDLGFIDGPGSDERDERTKAVLHAKERCNYIYLHDYNLKQFECFENDVKWIQCLPYSKKHNHFFIRKDILV